MFHYEWIMRFTDIRHSEIIACSPMNNKYPGKRGQDSKPKINPANKSD